MSRGVLLACIFALGWLPLLVFRVESVVAALPHYERWERVWVYVTMVLLSAHVTIACVCLSAMPTVSWGRAAVALALFAAAIGFWFWGRAQIGPLRLTRLPDEPPLRLRRDGAFGLVRHPLYFAMLVMTGAPVVASGRVLPALSWALCAVVIAVRAQQEERRLRAQLGAEYDAYCREVKGLIPFVW
jgi:protein-S-isoprenylcysteine O-methyltransferase Ste14